MSDEAARPVASEPDAAGGAGERDGPAISVEGNPSAHERAVLAAVVGALRDGHPAASGGEAGPATSEAEDDATGDASSANGEAGDPRGRIAYERRCPICGARFHSRRPLDGARQVAEADIGDARVCFDRVDERLYVHRSR